MRHNEVTHRQILPARPGIARLTVDTALQSGDGRLVWMLGYGFCLVILLQSCVSIVRAWAIAIFSTRVGYELKDRFVRSLHRKSARFFTTHHTTDILSRSHSVEMIQHIVTAELLQALMVAIVGPSGSGKTTLMHLLVGLLEPTQGKILINDWDLRTITSSDYAKVVGTVMQDDMLFQGTVAGNISFFDAPVDMARVVEVARRANIAHECESMPTRYYSLLAEAATDISGGQKQRLFIARALYHAPRILFLDEATSHLDAESETLVNRAITAMEITRVLVAHREDTIAMADRALEIDPKTGRLVERSPEIGTAPPC